MEGRMFKVSILLDNDKILKEGRYPIKDIYYNVEKIHADNGLLRDYDLADGSMVFYGVKGIADSDGIMNAQLALENSDWFMRYVKKWTGHENEHCKYRDDFVEEDVLALIKKMEKLARLAV